MARESARDRVVGVLSNAPRGGCTIAELCTQIREYPEHEIINELVELRTAGQVACTNGVWWMRVKA